MQAVASGAIASDYQRLRVESVSWCSAPSHDPGAASLPNHQRVPSLLLCHRLQVCSRLGLVSLGYLWHQPQDQLLSDMISTSIHAVLVKVTGRPTGSHAV